MSYKCKVGCQDSVCRTTRQLFGVDRMVVAERRRCIFWADLWL